MIDPDPDAHAFHIDYLFADEFEERFGFDPWDTPELHPKTHEVEIDLANDEGRLISVTDEGMVLAGWRLVNISHRGVCDVRVWENSVFLKERA